MNNHSTQISNVLIIGSGGAGLRAAIEAKQKGMDVTVLGKRQRTDVHTVLAAGGINAAFGNVDQEDSWEQHFADTYIEGYGLSEPEVVELMAKESPQLVEEIFEIVKKLNEKEGVSFLLAEQNTNVALRFAHFGYILESGRVVMDGPAEELRENPDVKEFYLGLSGDKRKSYRDGRSYRRRKRWLN